MAAASAQLVGEHEPVCVKKTTDSVFAKFFAFLPYIGDRPI